MSLAEWMKVGELVFVICQAIFLLVMFLLRSTFATKKDFGTTNARADAAHHRLDVLDERLKGFPDFGTINEIKDDIVEMKQAQSAGTAELRLMRETVGRIDDFLRQSR